MLKILQILKHQPKLFESFIFWSYWIQV